MANPTDLFPHPDDIDGPVTVKADGITWSIHYVPTCSTDHLYLVNDDWPERHEAQRRSKGWAWMGLRGGLAERERPDRPQD